MKRVICYVTKEGNLNPECNSSVPNVDRTNTWKIIGKIQSNFGETRVVSWYSEWVPKDLEIGSAYRGKPVVAHVWEVLPC